jgi:hypothetical protein
VNQHGGDTEIEYVTIGEDSVGFRYPDLEPPYRPKCLGY